MQSHPHALPQLNGGLFLTDSGLETVLCFQEGIDLPDQAPTEPVPLNGTGQPADDRTPEQGTDGTHRLSA